MGFPHTVPGDLILINSMYTAIVLTRITPATCHLVRNCSSAHEESRVICNGVDVLEWVADEYAMKIVRSQ